MEENQLEKLPKVVTDILKIVLSTALIALAIVLVIALGKVTYSLALMVINSSSTVPYAVAEEAVMFFLYSGITAMLRLIIVNHESATETILFAGAILIMVIALCLVLYSNKLRNI